MTPKPTTDEAESLILKTLKIRVKDKHAGLLHKMACQVNQVWNFANETSTRAIRERSQFMSGYDLQKYTAGYTKCDGVLLRAGTVEAVCAEYAARRRQAKMIRLNWRASNPAAPKRSLGWVPVKGVEFKYRAGQIHHAGHAFSLRDSYGLSNYDLRSASFNQDARGRWYFNVSVRVRRSTSTGKSSIGVDLGLKVAATTSDGQQLVGRHFRASEQQIAMAQRAGKKKQVRSLRAKVANKRKDAMHKFSTKVVAENGAVFVGNVSGSRLVKTTMAKSTYDAGWAMFKTMLEYKCHQAGVIFKVVDECYSTQTCNECGVIAGPKGRAGLKKRSWSCVCGAVHDRDINAAINIRARGLASLAAGARDAFGANGSSQEGEDL
jgi:putative transposase